MAHGAWALLPLLAIASASPQSNYDLQVAQILNKEHVKVQKIKILLEESFKSPLARKEKRERKMKHHILRLFQQSTKEVHRPSPSLRRSMARSLSWVSKYQNL